MMERFRLMRQNPGVDPSKPDPSKNGDVATELPSPIIQDNSNNNNIVEEEDQQEAFVPRNMSNMSEDEDPFMGLKVRRTASRIADYKGDYIDLPSRPLLSKILQKQGDKQVLFADKVLKFTGSGKIKPRILLITELSIYIIDPEANALKRRIALTAVEKMSLSALSDNFFAIIIPTEYDLLMVSTRKTEILTVLVRATKGASNNELKLGFSNSFEYYASGDMPKEINFEEVEGGVKTTILRK
ncbi:myosin ID heavy chain [Senna tora]|uniref:Myosin ID heavy chain n=1 Tax=Senna tora TaxID=362788 RepID=A0A834TU80_9FABA|nr:myosin ID heavy chain [Senna tora]